jgi:membrane dipeptidase
MKNSFILFITVLFLASCSTSKQAVLSNEAKANVLAQKYIITDGHVDLPYRLKILNFRFQKEYLGIPLSSEKGDFDFERAREGGLDAPFMSIYVPARLQTEAGESKALADSLIDMVVGICDIHPNNFRIAKSPSDLKANFKKKIVSLPMGMENGSPIEDNLNNIQHFKNRGISYITLTHSLNNRICDSSYDTLRIHNGLSAFGEDVIKEMNRVGIMVDISHVSDSTFYDVIKLTTKPVIASHSSCRHFTPGFERNMNDDMIKELAKNNGVIMINFGSSFIDMKIQAARDSMGIAYRAQLKENNLKDGDDEAQAILDSYFKNNPAMWSDVKVVADHIEHVKNLVGVEYVGFGSDFDGVGDSLPKGLKDVSDYPNLIRELLDRGFTESDIEKVCGGNLIRVWGEVLE